MAASFRIGERLLNEVLHDVPGASDGPAPERLLRAYAIDPTAGAQRGGVVALRVPFEKLAKCGLDIAGARFAIASPAAPGDQPDDPRRSRYDSFAELDFDDKRCLVEQGYGPSLADPRFVAQMVYAVAMTLDGVFRDALGRVPVFGLDRTGDVAAQRGRLLLEPWGAENEAQAWYDREQGAVRFGFYEAKNDARGYAPGSIVYNALSHDVIVHELSHAFLDSVHPHLTIPVNADVLAFHEAFADLMVVFQRLAYPELVKGQMAKARGKPAALDLLDTLGTGFAQTTTGGRTLREIAGEAKLDGAGNEPHARGEVLVQAVYRAFRTLLEQRIERIVTIATNGRGILREGALAAPLLDEIARLTAKTARMFQSMLIRALDYLPPLGLTFFDFLRAVIAADLRLVPVDLDGVREAWLEAFRFHRIFPADSIHFSEEALVDGVLIKPSPKLQIPALSFAETAFSSAPGEPITLDRAVVQAQAFHTAIMDSPGWREFLWEPSKTKPIFADDAEYPIEIVSIRSFARPGPRRMTEFGTIVQLVQPIVEGDDASGFLAAGAATLMFDSEGRLVALPSRPARNTSLRKEARRYSDSRDGRLAWVTDAEGKRRLERNYLKRLC